MIKPKWFENIKTKVYPCLNENIKTNVLIIGGGITGISCAYELSNYYDDITLVTMNDFFEGTTGATTAKVTIQHGYLYHDLIKKLGLKKAKAYFELNNKGLSRIKDIVFKENIDCDLEILPSYLYSYNNEEENLKKEMIAYNKLGIKAITKGIDGFDRVALEIENQANFHPLKYLSSLLEILNKKNVKIYRNTKILDVSKHIARTNHYKINADIIIIATGYPVYTKHRMFFTKLIPSISYVGITKPNIDIKQGNYINTKDPIFAFRNYNESLVISGLTHKSSKLLTLNKQHKLLDIAKTHFLIDNFETTWSTRDYQSVDLLPFIGKINNFTYIATGYAGWGMTNSVGASLLIKDLIQNNSNELSKVFNPKRIIFNPKIFKYNLSSIKTIILSKRNFEKIKEFDLSEGKIIKMNHTRYGVYRDEFNNIHFNKAKCTHLGCGLVLNKEEKLYECPCHGSRFNYNGKVIHGPAKNNLKNLIITDKEKRNG